MKYFQLIELAKRRSDELLDETFGLAPIPSPLDPLLWGVDAPLREQFCPLGRVTQLETNDRSILAAGRKSFAAYGAPGRSRAPEILLRLVVDPKEEESLPWGRPYFRAQGHWFYVACGRFSFAVVDLDRGQAAGFVSRAIAASWPLFAQTFLEAPFYVLATHRWYTPVHGAAVALQNRGVLLCGPAGAGKTTLAYACARAGMDLVSDDVLHVAPGAHPGQLTLWGRPWYLRLLADARALFPELAGQPCEPGNDREPHLEIDVEKEFPGKARTSCDPAAVVFLERCPGQGSRLRTLGSEPALRRLQQDVFLTKKSVMARHYRVLESLVERGAYVMQVGTEVSGAAALVAGLLDP